MESGNKFYYVTRRNIFNVYTDISTNEFLLIKEKSIIFLRNNLYFYLATAL